MLFQEAKVIQHRMIGGEVELADHADGVMPGLDAGELDALVGMEQFAAGQTFKKIEMPPGAAEFAVGGELQPGRGLLVHDLFDFHVLDLAQIVGRYFALLQSGARFLDARRPQQAADLVGAERGFCSLHGLTPGDFNVPQRRRRRESVRAPRDRLSGRRSPRRGRSRRAPISQHGRRALESFAHSARR